MNVLFSVVVVNAVEGSLDVPDHPLEDAVVGCMDSHKHILSESEVFAVELVEHQVEILSDVEGLDVLEVDAGVVDVHEVLRHWRGTRKIRFSKHSSSNYSSF